MSQANVKSKKGKTMTNRTLSFRRIVLQRDKICLRCFSAVGLHAHHIVALADGGEDDPEDNGIGLCALCHKEWHRKYEGKIEFNNFLCSVPGYIWLFISEKIPSISFEEFEPWWQATQLARMLTGIPSVQSRIMDGDVEFSMGRAQQVDG